MLMQISNLPCTSTWNCFSENGKNIEGGTPRRTRRGGGHVSRLCAQRPVMWDGCIIYGACCILYCAFVLDCWTHLMGRMHFISCNLYDALGILYNALGNLYDALHMMHHAVCIG